MMGEVPIAHRPPAAVVCDGRRGHQYLGGGGGRLSSSSSPKIQPNKRPTALRRCVFSRSGGGSVRAMAAPASSSPKSAGGEEAPDASTSSGTFGGCGGERLRPLKGSPF